MKGSKALKMYSKISDKTRKIAFCGSQHFPSEDSFYVLDLIECELQVRKMFLALLKKHTQRAKVTKV